MTAVQYMNECINQNISVYIFMMHWQTLSRHVISTSLSIHGALCCLVFTLKKQSDRERKWENGLERGIEKSILTRVRMKRGSFISLLEVRGGFDPWAFSQMECWMRRDFVSYDRIRKRDGSVGRWIEYERVRFENKREHKGKEGSIYVMRVIVTAL